MSTSASATAMERRVKRRSRLSGLKGAMPYAVCIGGFLLLWAALSLVIGSGRLPGPVNVIAETWDPYIIHPFFDDGGTSKGLGWQILISLQRVAMGYGLAAVAGIAIGGLLGLNRFVGKGFDPVIQVLRTVPPLAWFPISLMVFQDANTSAIFVIFITAIWPIIINTAVGIREIPQDYINVARVLRLRKAEYIRNIVIPWDCLEHLFVGHAEYRQQCSGGCRMADSQEGHMTPWPNMFTGANAGWPRQLANRMRWAAHVGQLCRATSVCT